MEEDKKKKKNKKKKNKQANTAKVLSVDIQGSSPADQIVNGFDQKREGDASQTAEQKASLDLEGHHDSISDGASLEEQIKLLQKEKDACINKEASLEEQIKQLQKDKDAYVNIEVELELAITQLKNEKELWLQKEVGYKEKISKLVDEASSTSLKMEDLEINIKQLETEREAWYQKKVGLEENIKQLETEKETWDQKENSFKETIAGLRADNSRLCSQVSELEEFRKNLLQENQQLTDSISILESQIQNSARLSTESSTAHAQDTEDRKSELLAAQTMVKKLLSENAKLVEKLNAGLDQKRKTGEVFSSIGSDLMVGMVDPAHGADGSALGPDPVLGTSESLAGDVAANPSSERTPLLNEKGKDIDIVGNDPENVGHYANHKNSGVVPKTETIVTEEIVQIPLEENELEVTKLKTENFSSVETGDVPITDAPLIGAPFRFISFVAKYVSGADLVNKSP